MTEMFGEAWPPMSVPDVTPDDEYSYIFSFKSQNNIINGENCL